jgi:hypothetical protein
LVAFFFSYFVIAVTGMLFADKREFFPVFSWSLFTNVTDVDAIYEIEISRVDDTVYDPPVSLFELKSEFDRARYNAASVPKTAAAYHRALNRQQQAADGDRSETDRLQSVIDDQYLFGHERVEYAIVLVQHNPLERWQTGATIHRAVIARLTTADSQ